jgi:uncharacterized membrane protein
MFKLIVMAFNELWRAEEVRLLALKRGNNDFESALAVQRKFDGTLTFNSIDPLDSKGFLRTNSNFWWRLRSLIFQCPPLAVTRDSSCAYTETISTIGIHRPFVEQIASRLQPGSSILMILVEEHQAGTIHSLAKQSGAISIENAVDNNDVQELSRTIERKILEISKRVR